MRTYPCPIWMLFLALTPPFIGLRTDSTAAGKDQGKISVEVTLVTVDVSVNGDPGRELRPEDFAVYDNGVIQELTHFSRDELPLTVALVVDISGSITSYQRELKDAALSALRALKADDQVVLYGFGTYTRRFTDLTRDFAQLSQKIGDFQVTGSTNICDALFIAARNLREKASRGRRAIILVSDNMHNVLWGQTWDSALQEILEAGATLYGIGIRGGGVVSGRGLIYSMPKNGVPDIARSTGGDALNVGTGMSLTMALNVAVSNLRQQYTLGYCPSGMVNDGSFHRLDVRFRDKRLCPKCKVAARRGYYARIQSSGRPVYVDRQIKPGVMRVDARIYNRITLAAADMDELQDIPFEMRTSAEGAGPIFQTRVDLRLDTSAVEFVNVDGRHTARLYIAFFYGPAQGSFVGTAWKIMDLKLDPDAYARMKSSGIPFSELVAGGPPLLKAVVYDPRGEKVGTRVLTLQK
jgi:Ca-activated chloride channel homolog